LIPLVAVLVGCATTPPAPQPEETTTGVDGGLEPLLPKVERQIRERFEKSGVPSLAVGVVYDGGLIWSRGFGVRDLATRDPVTSDTVFRIGSITKVLTGLALLQLRDDGRLRLDDPVSSYLPEIQGVIYPTAEHPPILIRHLVTHGSGVPRLGGVDYTEAEPVTVDSVLAALHGLPLEFTPGSENRYSNLAMGLAGLVVARAAGRPYRQQVRQRILEPLGMNETFWDESEISPGRLGTGYEREGTGWKKVEHQWHLGVLESMGGLYTSIADLARFAAFELDAWPPRDAPESPVLSRSSLRESQLVAGPQRPKDFAWGVNWGLMGNGPLGYRLWHGGGVAGYGSEILLFPDSGLGLIALWGGSDARLDGLLDEVAPTLVPAIPPREPNLAPPVATVFKALLDAVNDQSLALEHLFAKGWLDRLAPRTLPAMMRDFRQREGLCRVDRILEGGVYVGRVSLVCERGKAFFRLSVDTRPPYLINNFAWDF
jgi:CubicO group peptidase (beta-lactamase class C family)